jgi:periplasmic protein CpxP/Spy
MFKVRCLLAWTLFCVVGMATISAVAQDNGDSQPQPPRPAATPDHWRGRGQFDPAKRTEMLTKQLGLTSDQQPKVLDALKSEQSQMETLHSDSSLSQDDRRTKMMDIHKTTNDQVRAILDPDQQKKWDEMQSRREQWQGHHHDGQAPPSPPDSSDQNK